MKNGRLTDNDLWHLGYVLSPRETLDWIRVRGISEEELTAQMIEAERRWHIADLHE